MCVVCAQAFLRKSAVSRLLIKLTGSDQSPESLAPVLLARYDIDGNKVLDKVLVRCITKAPRHTAETKKDTFLLSSLVPWHALLCVWAIRTGARAWTAEKAHSPDRFFSPFANNACLSCSERAGGLD
jgi:hypothetical protein